MGVTVSLDRFKGLVDAANEQDFREKLCDLKERWDQFENCHHSVCASGKINSTYIL